ncbi:MAG TPA: MaoC family dehydratase N-terminal domain-containing protein [Streptosporangiaceae bacterium]
MPVNPDFAGRSFPPSEPYEVSRVKIAEFVQATGDVSPLCQDREAAQAAGYPDVIAPPTFAIVISMASSGHALADEGLGLNYSMVVHGGQQFEHVRPLCAGDVVIAQTTITDITPRRAMTTLTTRTDITTTGGEHVCTAVTMLVERGA